MRKANKLIAHAARAERLTTKELLDERRSQPLLARVAKVGLYKLVSKRLVNDLENTFGGPLIGSGFDQLVFQQSSERVVKVLIGSMGQSAAEISVLTEQQQRLFDESKQYLGEHWLDTAYYPVAIPRWLGSRALAAVQPAVKPIKKFATPEEVPTYRTTDTYRLELRDVVDSINELYKSTGMMPDLFGDGNLMLRPRLDQQDRLQFVDTMPETKTKMDGLMWNRAVTRRQALEETVTFWERSLDQLIAVSGSPVLAGR